MRTRALAVALTVLGSACGSGGGESTDEASFVATSLPATVATTPNPDTTTSTTTASTTTSVAGAGGSLPELEADPFVDVLVAASGLTLLGSDGSAAELIPGPVVRGMDDLRGGYLFQTEAGEYEGQYGDVNDPRSTIVWWLPAGASVPQELLVPTGDHQWLTLQDVVDIGGSPHVIYTRLVDDGAGTREETLRTFNIDTRSVSEISLVSGFESGIGPVSGGGGLFAYELHGEGVSMFIYRDGAGELTALPGDPYAGDVCDSQFEDGGPCYQAIHVDLESGTMAYTEFTSGEIGRDSVLTVVTLAGEGVAEWALPDGTIPLSIDLRAGYAIVNRLLGDAFATLPALMIDLATGEIIELSVNGEARFVRQEGGVAAPHPPPVDLVEVVTAISSETVPFADLLISRSDGVVWLGQGGGVLQVDLALGRAMDDWMGGLVFQLLDEASPIYWVPDGATTATVAAAHPSDGAVILHDVVRRSGNTIVLYERIEAELTAGEGKTLMYVTLETGVHDLISGAGGFHGGVGPASAGPDLLTYTWHDEGYGGILVLDGSGAPISGDGAFRTPWCEPTEWLPIPGDNHGNDLDGSCWWEVAAAADGSAVAILAYYYSEDGELERRTVFVRASDGTALAVIGLTDDIGPISGIEVNSDVVILNHGAADPAHLIAISTGETRRLAVAGVARFAESQPSLPGPIELP